MASILACLPVLVRACAHCHPVVALLSLVRSTCEWSRCPDRCQGVDGRVSERVQLSARLEGGFRCREAGQHCHDQDGRAQMPAVRQDLVSLSFVPGWCREVVLQVMEALFHQDAWSHKLSPFILEQVFVAEVPRGELAP